MTIKAQIPKNDEYIFWNIKKNSVSCGKQTSICVIFPFKEAFGNTVPFWEIEETISFIMESETGAGAIR